MRRYLRKKLWEMEHGRKIRPRRGELEDWQYRAIGFAIIICVSLIEHKFGVMSKIEKGWEVITKFLGW